MHLSLLLLCNVQKGLQQRQVQIATATPPPPPPNESQFAKFCTHDQCTFCGSLALNCIAHYALQHEMYNQTDGISAHCLSIELTDPLLSLVPLTTLPGTAWSVAAERRQSSRQSSRNCTSSSRSLALDTHCRPVLGHWRHRVLSLASDSPQKNSATECLHL